MSISQSAKTAVSRAVGKLGYNLVSRGVPRDMGEPFSKLHALCAPYTMTSPERLFAVHQAVHYLLDNNVGGDFVECGVWRGGSSMMACLTLLERGVTDRDLYLYDTFAGMTEPTELDKNPHGQSARALLGSAAAPNNDVFCFADIEEVRRNLASTGYPNSKLHFIKGPVEETIPSGAPTTIALLRLDTDWHASTYHELIHLFPALVTGGVLIIDDYGHWQGARSAVDQYFAETGIRPLLHRIDYTARMFVKQ